MTAGPLAAFASIGLAFQLAAMKGQAFAAFDYVQSMLDAVCQRASDAAEKRGCIETDTTDLVCVMGGEATAIGDSSAAAGKMRGHIEDVGLVSYALGTCTFTAAAQASGDDTAVAFTDTFAQVDGADFVIIFNVDYSTPLEAGADFSFSTSSTSFIAIDLEYWDSFRGPIYIEYDHVLSRYTVDADLNDGELAMLDVVLESFGEDTFTSLDSNVLTIEDTMSSVSAVATFA